MKILSLNLFDGDWLELVAEVDRTGEPVLLSAGGRLCGVLLSHGPASELAAQLERRTHVRAEAPEEPEAGTADTRRHAQTYLDLLVDDPMLVPVVDGRRLEFRTMMNTSYVDPQQLYEFEDPETHQIVTYRAKELQQAIGHDFAPVSFLPAHPAEFVRQQRRASQLSGRM